MGLRSLLSPFTIAERIRFVARCLRNRATVSWLMDDPRFTRELYNAREMLAWLVDDPQFARELYNARENIRSYLVSKWDLTKMAFNEGTIFAEEQPLLRELVTKANSLPGPIIEIGTLFGSTTTLLALWKSQSKKIITVDNYSWNPWQLNPLVHRTLTAQVLHYLAEKGEVQVVCQDKQEFFDSYRGGPPALVFLDADHSYEATKADIQWAKRIGASIICGHDYCGDHCPGVGQAVEEEGGAVRHLHGLWALNTEYWQRHRDSRTAEAA